MDKNERPDNVMPRKQKRPEKIKIRRKCYTCGTMKTDPYVYQIVPSVSCEEYPVYNPRERHIKRMDLKGDQKVTTSYYCDIECFENV
jgi:hypothetical protein